MKGVLFSFCFLLLNIPFFSQNKRATLQIKTDDKPSMHGFSYWQEIKISSKDTSFSASLHRSNPDVFKNLKPESYTVTISSLFNHIVSKKILFNTKTPVIKITGLSAFYK